MKTLLILFLSALCCPCAEIERLTPVESWTRSNGVAWARVTGVRHGSIPFTALVTNLPADPPPTISAVRFPGRIERRGLEDSYPYRYGTNSP